MGRSTTPKYALVLDLKGTTRQSWHVGKQEGGFKGYGKPTAENLAKHMEQMIESMKPGGVNYHLVQTFGTRAIPNGARIIHNDGSGRVVAEWKAPMFMLI